MTLTKENDLTGMKFGKLTPIKRAPDDRGRITWECMCDCGNTCLARADRLVSNVGSLRRSCGCIRKKKIFPDLPFGNAYEVLADYFNGAKIRSLEWELTVTTAMKLFAGNCHYCGRAPFNVRSRKKGEPFVHNGIDRLDPSKGYILDNCVSCCSRCNYFKAGMSEVEFISLVREIYEHMAKK